MNPRTRFNLIVCLGLAFWMLLAHSLFGFKLRRFVEQESLGALIGRLPGGAPAAAGAGLAVLAALAVLVVLANRRLPATPRGAGGGRTFTIAVAAGFVLLGNLALWQISAYPMPQEWSGLVAALAGLSLLLVAFVRTRTALIRGHVMLLVLALAGIAVPQLVPGHHAKISALRDCMQVGMAELEQRRRDWRLVDPGVVLAEAAVRAERNQVLRLDRRAEHVVAVEPPAPRDPEQVWATGYPRVDGEIRPALMVQASSTLRYRVRIPDLAPRLLFGLATADGNPPVTFEIAIGPVESASTVFTGTVGGASGWQDHAVDLEPWAGRETEVALAVRAGGGWWSNPVIVGARASSPNVVIYVVDCLRADHLGAYGYSRETSPVFDALASRGTLFERAYSNGTTTKRSIPSLFTSNPISATGVRYSADRLPDAFPTLAEILREMGYATAAFTTNSNTGPFSGTHQGFSRLLDVARLARGRSGDGPSPDAGVLIGDLLEQWIRDHADRNFLLYVHTMDAHGPYDPPPGYRGAYHDAAGSGEPVEWNRIYDPPWLEAPTRESRVALYDGEIAYGDHHLGRFLGMLREAGVHDETIFIFTADHGEYFGEHGMYGHNPPPFVQGTHVPLFMMGPGVPAGARVAENVQLMDILPTVLDALGLDPDPLLFQGSSLLPLAGGDRERFRERPVWIEGAFPGEASVHCGRLHYIPAKNIIFDLDRDPGESSYVNEFILDLGVKSLGRRLARAYDRTYTALHDVVAPGGADPLEVDPATIEQLRSLGYID